MGRREQWFGELMSAWPFGNSRVQDEWAGFYRLTGRCLKQILPLAPEFENYLNGVASRPALHSGLVG